jgi:hypothetical protein
MASRAEAEADPGWPELVEFLSVAGLEGAPLERVLVQLEANDLTNIHLLRLGFTDLAPELRLGSEMVIRNALAATQTAGGPQQPRVVQPPAAPMLPPVVVGVAISFKKQEATLRLALLGEDYSGKPLKALLPQINLHAAQHISGAYKIVGLSQGGARLDNAKVLRVQGVPPGGVLTAIVTELNAVFARAAGKATAAPSEPAPPPGPTPPPKPPPAPPPQQGSAATYTGQKPGPRPGAPRVDKKTKPPLWTVGGALAIDGCDCGARMDRMAEKVEKAGGVPAAGDSAGRAIWCVPCGKLQPLAKAFDLFPWNTHVSTEKHKGAARLRGVLQPPPAQGLEFGSEKWLAVRMAQWREMRAVRVARRRAA